MAGIETGPRKRTSRIWSLRTERGKRWASVTMPPPGGKPGLQWKDWLRHGLPLFAFCFFTARTNLVGGAMPFAIALLAGTMMEGRLAGFAAAGCALGALIGGSLAQCLACLALYGVYSLLSLARVRLSDLSLVLLTGGFAYLFPRFFALTLYDQILAGVAGVSALLLARMYATALRVRLRERELLSTEEVVCLALLLASLLAGMREVTIFTVSPVMVVLLFTCLVAGNLSGPGLGAAVGTLIGGMLGVTLPADPGLTGGMALCGLLCGIFAGLGRWGSAGGLLLGVVLSSALAPQWLTLPMGIAAVLAAILFLCLPRAWREELSRRVSREAQARSGAAVSTRAARLGVRERVDQYADLYLRMAQVLQRNKSSGQQYAAVGAALGAVGEEFGREIVYNQEQARAVAEACDREGVRVLECQVYRAGGRLQATVQVRHKTEEMLSTVTNAASRALGLALRPRPIPLDSPWGENRIELEEASRYRLLTGAAWRESCDGLPCGDNHVFRDLPDSAYMLAISDGMGHGAKACDESRAAVELMEDFLLARFDPDAAITGVNDLLLRRERGEMYATMDLALVDLASGRMRNLKIGAVPTFIRRGNQVLSVTGDALPMGIVESVAPAECFTQLMDGDVIVMVSDGILDAVPEGERWLLETLPGMDLRNPQAAAENLLDTARIATRVPDDMTVLVSRVFRR